MVTYRLDNRGVVKWVKRVGSVESNDLSSIALSSDLHIALSGRARYDGTTYGTHITTLSVDGAILMSKVYYLVTMSTYGKVVANVDGGFIVQGSAKFAPSTIYKPIVYKVNSALEVQWAVKVDDNLSTQDKYVYARFPMVASNGDIVIVGYMDKTESSLDDTFVLRLNANGEV